MRIPLSALCLAFVFSSSSLTHAAEPASQSTAAIRASDFHQSQIYHAPETPGYTSWCTLWRDDDDSLRLAFQQVTGPKENPAARKNVTVLMASDDAGKSWKTLREVPARAGVLDQHGIYAAPASSSFCGHGMARLPNGTLVTGLWSLAENQSGYVQRSTDDGKTWGNPIYLLDPADYRAYPTQVRRLHDGRLMIVAGVVRQADHKTQRYLTKMFFQSKDDGKTWTSIWTMPPEVGACEESDFAELPNGDLLVVHRAEHYTGAKYANSTRLQNLFHPRPDGSWEIGPVTQCPFPHSGFPRLLATREGPILHIATNGVHATTDAGQHWTKLDLPGSPYYPEAEQLKDGTVLVVGHVGSDNIYGTVDQSIIRQTFRLTSQK